MPARGDGSTTSSWSQPTPKRRSASTRICAGVSVNGLRVASTTTKSLPAPCILVNWSDSTTSISDVEPEVHDVAFAHHVVLALEPHLPRFLGTLLAVARQKVRERDHLRADEATLEVGVDDAGRLRCGVAGVDRPGADFLRPLGE